jgi:hypothetical protein
LDLFRINLDASELKRFGLENNTAFNSKLRKKVEQIALTSVDAFKTTVPIDLGSLRNQKINYSLYSNIKEASIEARVYVEDSPHLGRRTYQGRKGELVSSADIARALQNGKNPAGKPYSRSQDSHPSGRFNVVFPKYSRTAGWITDGQELTLRAYKDIK